MTEHTNFTFPCDFQIKIIGVNHASFKQDMTHIAENYFPLLKEAAVTQKPSKQGQYLALTISVWAQDKATLDALYTELSRHPDVKMVL